MRRVKQFLLDSGETTPRGVGKGDGLFDDQVRDELATLLANDFMTKTSWMEA
jgi:hypothetical protein